MKSCAGPAGGVGYAISIDLAAREAADARLGRDPVVAFARLQHIEDRCASESITRGIFDEPLTVEAVQPLHRAEPEKAARVEDDAADVVVGESVCGRVDPHRQLLRVDGRGCRQHHRPEQRCQMRGDETRGSTHGGGAAEPVHPPICACPSERHLLASYGTRPILEAGRARGG